jgi:hypothetical protein
MKAYIGVDVDSSLTHTAATTPANEFDVAQEADLRRAKEKATHGDSAFTSAYGYVEKPKLTRVVATRYSQVETIANALERVRALLRENRRPVRSWSPGSGS